MVRSVMRAAREKRTSFAHSNASEVFSVGATGCMTFEIVRASVAFRDNGRASRHQSGAMRCASMWRALLAAMCVNCLTLAFADLMYRAGVWRSAKSVRAKLANRDSQIMKQC
jgi:hypothetical protein